MPSRYTLRGDSARVTRGAARAPRARRPMKTRRSINVHPVAAAPRLLAATRLNSPPPVRRTLGSAAGGLALLARRPLKRDVQRRYASHDILSMFNACPHAKLQKPK